MINNDKVLKVVRTGASTLDICFHKMKPNKVRHSCHTAETLLRLQRFNLSLHVLSDSLVKYFAIRKGHDVGAAPGSLYFEQQKKSSCNSLCDVDFSYT